MAIAAANRDFARVHRNEASTQNPSIWTRISNVAKDVFEIIKRYAIASYNFIKAFPVFVLASVYFVTARVALAFFPNPITRALAKNSLQVLPILTLLSVARAIEAHARA